MSLSNPLTDYVHTLILIAPFQTLSLILSFLCSGDGRAMALGEVVNGHGERYELQVIVLHSSDNVPL